jgi:hypothetical protein
MAATTRRFGLTVLDSSTDQLNYANYKFSDGDRVLLDQLLRVAVEDHTHTAQSISVVAPDVALLRVGSGDGAIPPNLAVYYRYTIVDARGQATIASATANTYTPVPATAPGYGPRLSTITGFMEAGGYLYACSACTFESSQETIVGPTTAGTLTNYGGWRLDLPPMPTGGHFFNVYRKGPRETELKFLATLAASDRVFFDDGTLDTNRLRSAPQANTTYRANSIEVSLPGTFVAPTDSWTWKLFRTYDPTNWENSLLDWIGPDNVYIDDGRATRAGYPPSTTSAVGGAPKIDINTDTVGEPPESAASGVTRQINFNADLVQAGVGDWYWICEYEHAELQSMWATVNRTNPPTLQDCTIGLDLLRAGEDTWSPLLRLSLDPLVSTVRVGQTIGERTALVLHEPSGYLMPGDKLRLHVYDAGYEPEVTDHDLTLAVTLRVHQGLSEQTYQWETS